MLTFADVLEALTGTRPEAASLVISEAAIDSRQVIPAGMFVALRGERVDGHEYIQQAFDRGAHIALVQREPGIHCPLVDLHRHYRISRKVHHKRINCRGLESTLSGPQESW